MTKYRKPRHDQVFQGQGIWQSDKYSPLFNIFRLAQDFSRALLFSPLTDWPLSRKRHELLTGQKWVELQVKSWNVQLIYFFPDWGGLKKKKKERRNCCNLQKKVTGSQKHQRNVERPPFHFERWGEARSYFLGKRRDRRHRRRWHCSCLREAIKPCQAWLRDKKYECRRLMREGCEERGRENDDDEMTRYQVMQPPPTAELHEYLGKTCKPFWVVRISRFASAEVERRPSCRWWWSPKKLSNIRMPPPKKREIFGPLHPLFGSREGRYQPFLKESSHRTAICGSSLGCFYFHRSWRISQTPPSVATNPRKGVVSGFQIEKKWK